MSDAYDAMRDELRTERRRTLSRHPDADTDPTRHEPTLLDRLYVEPPLTYEEES